MPFDPLTESARQRAKRDTLSAYHTLRFWIFEGCMLAALTIWVLLWQPCWAKDWAKIVYQVIVPLLGVFAGLALVFFASLFVAPYRQRDEARSELTQKRKVVPLRNREKLLEAIYEAEKTTVELAMFRKSYNQTSANVNVEEMEAVKKTYDRCMDSQEALRKQKKVAGADYEALINSLLVFMQSEVVFNSGDSFMFKTKLERLT